MIDPERRREGLSRSFDTLNFKTRTSEDGEKLFIEGYFAVFNEIYKIWDDVTESIAPGTFFGIAGEDVRALINHDTTLVLGRTAANTLELREDSYGLWGRIEINPKDLDAMNLYERVMRGDVTQCSFGFDILDEETEYFDDGGVHFTIKSVKLYEVSVCTFPAYTATHVDARDKDIERAKARGLQAWKEKNLRKLRGK